LIESRGGPGSGALCAGRPGLARVRLAHCRELLLQRHVRRLHGIQAPLKHTRLVARVAELRLQGFDGAAVIGLTPVGPLRGLVEFLLQLRAVSGDNICSSDVGRYLTERHVDDERKVHHQHAVGRQRSGRAPRQGQARSRGAAAFSGVGAASTGLL